MTFKKSSHTPIPPKSKGRQAFQRYFNQGFFNNNNNNYSIAYNYYCEDSVFSPVVTPATPVKKTSTPVKKMSTPAKKMSTPAKKPEVVKKVFTIGNTIGLFSFSLTVLC